MLLRQKYCNDGDDDTNGENAGGAINSSTSPNTGGGGGSGGAGRTDDGREGGRVVQTGIRTTRTNGDHDGSGLESSGVTEHNHNIGSGRDRHLVPGERSTSDVGESLEVRTTSTAVVERLEKASEFWF